MLRNTLNVLATVMLILSAYVSFNLGMDWINFGYGIHPIIAFPCMIVLAVAALASHCWFPK
jgi:hypothetical protein